MNKDTIFATLIGLVLGLVLTGIVLFAPNLFKNLPQFKLPSFSMSTPKQNTKPKITPTPATIKDPLTIQSPLPDSIETSDQLVVSGQTKPNATVVVSGPNDDDIQTANSQGSYANTITLSEGKNDIVVTSYFDDTVNSKSVTIFYTQEKI